MRPLDLLAVVAELRLVERLAPMLPDDDVGVWLRCWHQAPRDVGILPTAGNAAIVSAVGTMWVPRVAWVPRWVPN